MPNTLAHIGLHGLATKAVFPKVDLKWIYLGAILPDLPWILQRIVRILAPGIDPLDLRLYAIVQASLFFCLILSAGLALFSTFPRQSFIVLGTGSAFHLFLDILQHKWANGVHFFAPISWRLSHFGLVWPESLPTYLVTAFGLGYCLFYWSASLRSPFPLSFKNKKKVLAGLALLLLYLLVPFALLDGPEAQDNHFVKTLRAYEDRPGKIIEMDRADYEHHPKGGTIRTFSGEGFAVEGLQLNDSSAVSIRGVFTEKNRVRVQDYHIHSRFRDWASYLGLSLIAFIWLISLYREYLEFIEKRKKPL